MMFTNGLRVSILSVHKWLALHAVRPGILNLPDGNRRLLYTRYIYIYCVVLKVDKEEEDDDV